MNLYEHTLIVRQDISPSQLKQVQEKYTKLVEKFDLKTNYFSRQDDNKEIEKRKVR